MQARTVRIGASKEEVIAQLRDIMSIPDFAASRRACLPYRETDTSAYNPAMPGDMRSYNPADFSALYKLDQKCFPPGIAYSKNLLRYFLTRPGAECIVIERDSKIVGFILTEENPPLAHIVTLDVLESYRRQGVGTALLKESETNLALRGVRTVLLETATSNEAGVAFWQRHGYRIEAVLKNYYPGRLDAYEMRKLLPAANREAPKAKGEKRS